MARIPDLVGTRLPSPYHFPARIQSFQAVAAPFPGDSFAVSLSRRDPGDRNASVQKIDDRLGGLLRDDGTAQASRDLAQPKTVAQIVFFERRTDTKIDAAVSGKKSSGGAQTRNAAARQSARAESARHPGTSEGKSSLASREKLSATSLRRAES
jgi:hypothetical protein